MEVKEEKKRFFRVVFFMGDVVFVLRGNLVIFMRKGAGRLLDNYLWKLGLFKGRGDDGLVFKLDICLGRGFIFFVN